jgi:hypothetical protein
VLALAQILSRSFGVPRGARVIAANQAANQRALAAPSLPRFTEGTAVVVVGEITSQPKDAVNERKMQVGVGPGKTDVTLHLSDAKLYNYEGAPVGESRLDTKMWVRAEGTVMDDPRRVKVTRLQVIGKDMAGLHQSTFHRPGFDQGYMVAVAGTRQIYPMTEGAAFTPAPFAIVGRVASDTGALESTRKIQVDAAGNTWTLSVPKDTPIFDAKGQKISVHEIAKGQWVRAHGWQTDDLRMRIARIENIGPEEAFKSSAYDRAAAPIGYLERTPGTGVRFNPLTVTGTVSRVSVADGILALRDERGMERTFFLETLTIQSNGRLVDAGSLQNGQRVTVQGSEIVFQ